MSDCSIVLTTFPDAEKARQIGTQLVEKQLVACVNLLSPCESIYRWKGKVCREAEIPAILKTTDSKLEELEEILRKLHPYEVPEFIVLSIDDGSGEYLEWVRKLGG